MKTSEAIKFIIDSTGMKKGKILFICVICMISACLHTGMNLVLLPLIDNTIMGTGGVAVKYAVAFILFVVLNTAFKYIRKYGINMLCISSEMYLTEKAIKKLGDKQMAFFENSREGEITLLINNRIKNYRFFLMDNIENFIFEPIDFIITFFAVWYVDKKVASIVFAVIILSAIGNFFLSNRIVRSSQNAYAAEDELRNYQKEIVENYDNVIMSHLNVHVAGIHQKKVERMLEKENILTKEGQWAYIPALLNEYLPTIIFLLLATFKISKGELTYGGFASLLSLISGVSLPITYYLRSFTRLKEQFPFIQKMRELLLDDDSRVEHEIIPDTTNIQNMVVFQNVSFSYDGKNECMNNLSYTVKKGEKIGIVGASGTGKSTMIKLIMGFYKPDTGEVKTLGEDAFQNQQKIWEKVAYVDNENFLFEGTIEYNITLKDDKLTGEEKRWYREICDTLCISDMENEERDIKQFGRNLSGGQRLRISLARALYRRAELLVLDEPSSSFDNQTEKLVIELLKEIDSTVILTTHRMGLLDICDRVISLKDGGIQVIEKVGEEKNEENIIAYDC